MATKDPDPFDPNPTPKLYPSPSPPMQLDFFDDLLPSLPSPPLPCVSEPIICECGAAKIGIEDYAPGHSDWCPVHESKKEA